MRKMLVQHVEPEDDFDVRAVADLVDLKTGRSYCVGVVEFLSLNKNPRLFGHESDIIDTELYVEWAHLCDPFELPDDVDYIQRGVGIWAKAKVLAIAAKDTLICEIKGLADRIVVDDLVYTDKVGETIYVAGSLSIDYHEHHNPDQWMIPYDPELG